MFGFLRKNKKAPRRSIIIPLIGTLYYVKEPERNFWFGRVDTISPNSKLELSIEPSNGTEPSEEQIKSIQELPADYNYYMEMLYIYLDVAFDEVPLETIKQWYYLAAIELKKYNNEWFFTLEPGFNVPPIYNHFQRFSIVNKMITWSNVSLE
ncbi:MAG: hypothetical protein JWQ66_3576 [Mucilaginibacter sp.]|nr:hypothetical protein [Mucilaginibacter sp.]